MFVKWCGPRRICSLHTAPTRALRSRGDFQFRAAGSFYSAVRPVTVAKMAVKAAFVLASVTTAIAASAAVRAAR
jgi:hypothetical protein